MATAKKAAKKTGKLTKAPAAAPAVKKPRAAKKATRAPAAAKKAPVSPKVQRSIDKLTKDIATHVAKKSAAITKIAELRAQLKALKNPTA